jgi:methylated-DNA-[protein]-cysteine S-methyltransferase
MGTVANIRGALSLDSESEQAVTELTMTRFTSPLGEIHAVLADGRLCEMDFSHIWATKKKRLVRRFGSINLVDAVNPDGLADKLSAYFAGDVHAIDDIAVDPGGTEFQRKVWRELRAIPAGETRSYGEFAKHIGHAQGPRAVGAANGQNPVAVVIPCHRLIGANGALTGYASGIEYKQWLLQHEGALPRT